MAKATAVLPSANIISVDDVSYSIEVVAGPNPVLRKEIGDPRKHSLPYIYHLEVQCETEKSRYIARGNIQFITLTQQKYPFVFQTSKPGLGSEGHCFTLNQKIGRYEKFVVGAGSERRESFCRTTRSITREPIAYTPMIQELLGEENLGQLQQREVLAKTIAKELGDIFTPSDSLSKPETTYSFPAAKVHRIEQLACADYKHFLEGILKSDPWQPLLPKKYLYELDSKEVWIKTS